MYFGFEYFTGANVVIEIGGVPLLEAAGLSLQTMESRRPIYPYHSRHFAAVSRGQVLVQGDLLINMVHHSYLEEAIKMYQDGFEFGLEPLASISDRNVGRNRPQNTRSDHILENEDQLAYALIEGNGNQGAEEAAVERLRETAKEHFWGSYITEPERIPASLNPHDFAGNFTLKVTFGERKSGSYLAAGTGYTLQGVYFLGRAQRIELDDIVVESYPFIARNILELS